MVIGWACSRDLFETSWEGLHEVLSSPKRAECLRVCFHCLSGVILTLNRSYCIRTYTPDAGDHGELFWSGFGWDDSHPYAHTEAKYTGIMPYNIHVNFAQRRLTTIRSPSSDRKHASGSRLNAVHVCRLCSNFEKQWIINRPMSERNLRECVTRPRPPCLANHSSSYRRTTPNLFVTFSRPRREISAMLSRRRTGFLDTCSLSLLRPPSWASIETR